MSGPTPAQAAAAINNLIRLGQVALFGGLTVYGVSHSIFNVEGGHRAVVFNRLVGIKDTVSVELDELMQPSPHPVRGRHLMALAACAQVYEEGTHLMVPWFERPIIYDVRAKPVNIQSASGSKDLQTVRRPISLRPPPALAAPMVTARVRR